MRTKLTACALVTTLAITGCANMNDTQKKTATGAGAGALAGAVLGAVTGPRRLGTCRSRCRDRWSGRRRCRLFVGQSYGKTENRKCRPPPRVPVLKSSRPRIIVSKSAFPVTFHLPPTARHCLPQFKTILRDLATTLKNNPSTSITVIGYTDNTGTDAINIPLSRQRAESVMNYLVSPGVSSSRFTVEGKGSSDPIASNDTAAGRAQNRRVEIYVGERAK